MPMPYVISPTRGSSLADEWLRLGVESHVNKDIANAENRYKHALRLDPANALATQNLAIVFAQKDSFDEAALAFERAEMLDDTDGIIKMNRAMLCMELGMMDEAVDCAHRGHDIERTTTSRQVLAMAYNLAAMPLPTIRLYEEILANDPADKWAGLNLCYAQTLVHATQEQFLAHRRNWWKVNGYKGNRLPHDNDRDPDRPLRVGYVGGDFRLHSAAMIFGRVLLHHSPNIEQYIYCSMPTEPHDRRTCVFREAVGPRWRDIYTANDEQAEADIRKDKIDILVDLASHTAGGRLPLFSRKPAPVQVTAWGFAVGTGCDEIDYFFADPITVPIDERQHFAEEIYDLPCIVTFEPPEKYKLKTSDTLPCHQNGVFTFGCFARFEKMSDECLLAFAEILRCAPDSRLYLKDKAFRLPFAMRRVLSFMDGIDPKRILFGQETSHPDHLMAFQNCDLGLDPFWHAGGTVGLEMLYMGCPFITLYGPHVAGRLGASMLTAMGRGEWIAQTVDEYIDLAIHWSNDRDELLAARRKLRKEFLNSPIVNGYDLAVENAYRNMWRRYVGS